MYLGSRGSQSAYTADEFHRLFRAGFGQDFVKEKLLNQTVETFLDDHQQAFSLFEYAVDLINEVDSLREQLQQKRAHISDLFSRENVDSMVVKDQFSILEVRRWRAFCRTARLDYDVCRMP